MDSRRNIIAVGLASVLAFLLTRIVLGAQGDGFGKAYWQPNGVPLCLAPGLQGIPHVTSDGDGGLITAWTDCRSPLTGCDIYAQRVAKDGDVLWQIDGVPVSTAPDDQLGPRIVSDNGGGALIAWSDYRNALGQSVYAQRLDSLGNRVWNSDGITITIGSDNQPVLELVPDFLGGAFVIWEEWSGHPITPVNVTPWEAQQGFAVAAPDSEGGAYIAWIDKYTDQAAYDVWTQHIGANGTRLWPGHGVQAVGAVGAQWDMAITGDGHNSFIAAWQDYRNGRDNPDLYAQRIGDVAVTRYFLPLVQKMAK